MDFLTLRDKIIYALISRRGEFISGQEIARGESVSRSAVAKCINSLKDEGFDITSVNNLGHKLNSSAGVLSEGAVRAYLKDDEIDIRIFQTIDSTNTEAKRAIANGLTSDALFVANEQTAGRGRRGRSFYSPKEDGIYFSCVLHPEVSLADSTAITSAAAVAVCQALEATTKKHPLIKWVNDIFIDNYKVCGILTEAISDFESGRVDAVIVGIGINLTTEIFPEELKGIAASVGVKLDRCALVADIYSRLSALCDTLPEKKFMDKYREYSLVLGKAVYFSRNGTDYQAKAVAINDNGELEVVIGSGEKMILNSGEISVKLS